MSARHVVLTGVGYCFPAHFYRDIPLINIIVAILLLLSEQQSGVGRERGMGGA